MISVVICTRNRSASLARTLASLVNVSARADVPWEIVIVDNDSRDDTKAIVDKFAAQAKVETWYVLEKRRGLSYARNAGVRSARGDVIAFTDDDMILDPGWVLAIADELRLHADVSVVFGQTRILRPELPPIAVREGESEQTYLLPCNPAEPGSGNNMIIVAAVFQKIGEFDITLGAGSNLPGAEERDLVYRVLRNGGTVRYNPRILAYHDHDRVSRRRLWSLLFDYGVGVGGFYCKYALRKDIWSVKCCFWEIKGFLKVMVQRGRIVGVLLHLSGMALGCVRRFVLETKSELTGELDRKRATV